MKSRPRLLVLDNDAIRHDLFRAAAWDFDLESTYCIEAFRAAVRDEQLPDVISLDHDLGDIFHAEGDLPDECGCDAADLVAENVVSETPVLIHSSNVYCAGIMRRILLLAGHKGRVAIVNTSTVFEYSEGAGVATLRQALLELLGRPLWPEAASFQELISTLGGSPLARCPVRLARGIL